MTSGILGHPECACSGSQGTSTPAHHLVFLSRVAGVIAYGIDRVGHHVRASGWGPAFLDGGCGYDLGQKALAAVARAADGRGPATGLTAALFAACSASQPEELIR